MRGGRHFKGWNRLKCGVLLQPLKLEFIRHRTLFHLCVYKCALRVREMNTGLKWADFYLSVAQFPSVIHASLLLYNDSIAFTWCLNSYKIHGWLLMHYCIAYASWTAAMFGLGRALKRLQPWGPRYLSSLDYTRQQLIVLSRQVSWRTTTNAASGTPHDVPTKRRAC